jgi:hypothetical protein
MFQTDQGGQAEKTCRDGTEVYIDGQKFVDVRQDKGGSLYVERENARLARLIAGGSLLGGGYILSLGIMGAIGTSPSSAQAAGFEASSTWMAVPIIGSYLFAGMETPHQMQKPESVTETCSGTMDRFLCIKGTSYPRALGQFQLALLTTPATLQLVGWGILALGLMTEAPPRVIIYPASIPGGSGFNMIGRF